MSCYRHYYGTPGVPSTRYCSFRERRQGEKFGRSSTLLHTAHPRVCVCMYAAFFNVHKQTMQTTSSSRDLQWHEAGPYVSSSSSPSTSSTALQPFFGSCSPCCLGFKTSEFLNDEDVSPLPNVHLGDPGSLYLSGISLKTSQVKAVTPETRLMSTYLCFLIEAQQSVRETYCL